MEIIEKSKTSLKFWNNSFDKNRLKTFVCWFLKTYGEKKTIELLEQFKNLGFGYATQAGVSLGIDDLLIPKEKMELLYSSNKMVLKNNSKYKNARITAVEKIQLFIDTWNQTSENLKKEVISNFEKTNIFNPVYMMAFSGARGNISQVRQLVGMRGLMSDPQGNIIDFPIQSNFREGLTLTEYLISTYGARKGIVDTALRTATAGYLTRRLVDVAQHVMISLFDCKTTRGIFLFDMKEGNRTLYSFQNRLIGRVLATDIKIMNNLVKVGQPSQVSNHDYVSSLNTPPSSLKPPIKGREVTEEGNYGQSIFLGFRNQEISTSLATKIAEITKKAFVRSPLTCQSSKFVCQLCYGWSLSSNKLVSLGEAVGVIAAQSIGEPGTQLTMRTFHTGGVFSGGLTESVIANYDGWIEYLEPIPGTCIRTLQGKIAFLTKAQSSFVLKKSNNGVTQKGNAEQTEVSFHKIPGYAILFARHKQKIFKKQIIAQFSSVAQNLSNMKTQKGNAEQTVYADLEGEIFLNQIDLLEQKSNNFPEDTLWKSYSKSKIWILSGKIYQNFILAHKDFNKFLVQTGDFVNKNSVFQRICWYNSQTNYIQFLTNFQKIFLLSNIAKKKALASAYNTRVGQDTALPTPFFSSLGNSANTLKQIDRRPSASSMIEPLLTPQIGSSVTCVNNKWRKPKRLRMLSCLALRTEGKAHKARTQGEGVQAQLEVSSIRQPKIYSISITNFKNSFSNFYSGLGFSSVSKTNLAKQKILALYHNMYKWPEKKAEKLKTWILKSSKNKVLSKNFCKTEKIQKIVYNHSKFNFPTSSTSLMNPPTALTLAPGVRKESIGTKLNSVLLAKNINLYQKNKWFQFLFKFKIIQTNLPCNLLQNTTFLDFQSVVNGKNLQIKIPYVYQYNSNFRSTFKKKYNRMNYRANKKLSLKLNNFNKRFSDTLLAFTPLPKRCAIANAKNKWPKKRNSAILLGAIPGAPLTPTARRGREISAETGMHLKSKAVNFSNQQKFIPNFFKKTLLKYKTQQKRVVFGNSKINLFERNVREGVNPIRIFDKAKEWKHFPLNAFPLPLEEATPGLWQASGAEKVINKFTTTKGTTRDAIHIIVRSNDSTKMLKFSSFLKNPNSFYKIKNFNKNFVELDYCLPYPPLYYISSPNSLLTVPKRLVKGDSPTLAKRLTNPPSVTPLQKGYANPLTPFWSCACINQKGKCKRSTEERETNKKQKFSFNKKSLNKFDKFAKFHLKNSSEKFLKIPILSLPLTKISFQSLSYVFHLKKNSLKKFFPLQNDKILSYLPLHSRKLTKNQKTLNMVSPKPRSALQWFCSDSKTEPGLFIYSKKHRKWNLKTDFWIQKKRSNSFKTKISHPKSDIFLAQPYDNIDFWCNPRGSEAYISFKEIRPVVLFKKFSNYGLLPFADLPTNQTFHIIKPRSTNKYAVYMKKKQNLNKFSVSTQIFQSIVQKNYRFHKIQKTLDNFLYSNEYRFTMFPSNQTFSKFMVYLVNPQGKKKLLHFQFSGLMNFSEQSFPFFHLKYSTIIKKNRQIPNKKIKKDFRTAVLTSELPPKRIHGAQMEDLLNPPAQERGMFFMSCVPKTYLINHRATKSQFKNTNSFILNFELKNFLIKNLKNKFRKKFLIRKNSKKNIAKNFNKNSSERVFLAQTKMKRFFTCLPYLKQISQPWTAPLLYPSGVGPLLGVSASKEPFQSLDSTNKQKEVKSLDKTKNSTIKFLGKKNYTFYSTKLDISMKPGWVYVFTNMSKCVGEIGSPTAAKDSRIFHYHQIFFDSGKKCIDDIHFEQNSIYIENCYAYIHHSTDRFVELDDCSTSPFLLRGKEHNQSNLIERGTLWGPKRQICHLKNKKFVFPKNKVKQSFKLRNQKIVQNQKCRYLFYKPEVEDSIQKISLLIRPVFSKILPNSFIYKNLIYEGNKTWTDMQSSIELIKDYHSNLLNKQVSSPHFFSSFASFDFKISKIALSSNQKKAFWFNYQKKNSNLKQTLYSKKFAHICGLDLTEKFKKNMNQTLSMHIGLCKKNVSNIRLKLLKNLIKKYLMLNALYSANLETPIFPFLTPQRGVSALRPFIFDLSTPFSISSSKGIGTAYKNGPTGKESISSKKIAQKQLSYIDKEGQSKSDQFNQRFKDKTKHFKLKFETKYLIKKNFFRSSNMNTSYTQFFSNSFQLKNSLNKNFYSTFPTATIQINSKDENLNKFKLFFKNADLLRMLPAGFDVTTSKLTAYANRKGVREGVQAEDLWRVTGKEHQVQVGNFTKKLLKNFLIENIYSLPSFKWSLLKKTAYLGNQRLFYSYNSEENQVSLNNFSLYNYTKKLNKPYFSFQNSFLFYKFNLVLKNQVFANTDILSPFIGEFIKPLFYISDEPLTAPFGEGVREERGSEVGDGSNKSTTFNGLPFEGNKVKKQKAFKQNSWWNNSIVPKGQGGKHEMNHKIFLTKKDMFSIFIPRFESFSSVPFIYSIKQVGSKRKETLTKDDRLPKILQFNFAPLGESDHLICSVSSFNNYEISQKQEKYNLSLKKLFLVTRNVSNHPMANNENLQEFQIQKFLTKYQKRLYKLKGLSIGKPNRCVKLCLGNFVLKGDLLNPSRSFHKTGQIIHFNSRKVTLRYAQCFLISANGILHVHQADPIFQNAPIFTLPFDTFTTGDIVQGIPKVEQYLEARTTQNGRPFLYSLSILLQGIFKRYCTKFTLQQAVSQSFLKIQLIIVDGVQRVYRSQGVSIADKHLEVIVKQMTSKVQIIHGGQTGFFPGELVELEVIENINPFLMIQIQYEPVVLGITRASLEVESFLSAASFQQTTKILAKASLYKKKDFLKGLKENILIGNLIPAGTGYMNVL